MHQTLNSLKGTGFKFGQAGLIFAGFKKQDSETGMGYLAG